jgi:hypothetical protein
MSGNLFDRFTIPSGTMNPMGSFGAGSVSGVSESREPAPPPPAPQAPQGGLDARSFAKATIGHLEALYLEFNRQGGQGFESFRALLSEAVGVGRARIESAADFGPSTPTAQPAPQRRQVAESATGPLANIAGINVADLVERANNIRVPTNGQRSY